jgi:hypothetical protein
MFRHHGKTQAILFGCILLMSACSSGETTSQGTNLPKIDLSQNQAQSESGSLSGSKLCKSMDALFEQSNYEDYGVKIKNCGAIVSDDGEDVFALQFNDPAEWTDLVEAMGDIDEEDAARYALWRLPLGLLSLSFANSKVNPNFFDTMLISFDNQKKTVYVVLPRDVAYVIATYDSSNTKEEFSDDLNRRIDEISERVNVANLAE